MVFGLKVFFILFIEDMQNAKQQTQPTQQTNTQTNRR